MPRGNRFTRRGFFGAGAAGAAVAGLSACGDDIGHWNPDGRLVDTPNLDALGRDSLSFRLAVPEAMPTGAARRGLLTGVRSFPFRNYVPTDGLPVGPGWSPIPDTYPIV